MITVLGTGSTGNCYLLEGGNDKLLLDCGIEWKQIQHGLKFNYKNTSCLLSHSHCDHSRAAKKLIENGIDIYSSDETLSKIGINGSHRIHNIYYEKQVIIRGFTVLPLRLHHKNTDGTDCACMGFLIKHKEIGKILFVTDTYYFEYTFRDLDYIMIEANYSEKLLEELEDYKTRIFNSHMSLETCKKFLEKTDTSKTKEILLIHLSLKNADKELFKAEVENIVSCKVGIASKGYKIRM